MKIRPFILIMLALAMVLGCSKDNVDTVILSEIKYDIIDLHGAVVGTVKFTEDSNMTTEVLIELTGTSTSTHPAFIRYNKATFTYGSPTALTLKACECSISHTVVSKLDDGTPISFNGLSKLDGHVSIQQSATDATIIAIANIGLNAQ
ncbi:MAG: hypothetical protein MUO53_05425 [Maribacter sp.]|nr:hypothetical protein [Maribacter sp.]